jgi:hypothetical protein
MELLARKGTTISSPQVVAEDILYMCKGRTYIIEFRELVSVGEKGRRILSQRSDSSSAYVRFGRWAFVEVMLTATCSRTKSRSLGIE